MSKLDPNADLIHSEGFDWEWFGQRMGLFARDGVLQELAMAVPSFTGRFAFTGVKGALAFMGYKTHVEASLWLKYQLEDQRFLGSPRSPDSELITWGKYFTRLHLVLVNYHMLFKH